MYKKLGFYEGLKVLLRVTQTYSCMAQYRPLYTTERLTKLYESNNDMLDMVIFHRLINNVQGITGFMDDYKDPDKIIIWANNTLGVKNEGDLRDSNSSFYQLICDYSEEKGRKIFYAKNVLWKSHKPEWLGVIQNWKEVMEDVAKDYFVDFKIDDNKIVEFIVK